MPNKWPLEAFKPGMTLKADLFFDGGLLLGKDTEITDRHLARLSGWDISEVDTESSYNSLAELVSVSDGDGTEILDLDELGIIPETKVRLPKGYDIDDGKSYVVEGSLQPDTEGPWIIAKNVLIGENISAKVELEVTGTLTISGTIAAGAKIKATGEIIIKGAVLGGSESMVLIEGSRVNLNTVEFAEINAQLDLTAVTISHCKATAGNVITITDPTKGIVASNLEAGASIISNVVAGQTTANSILKVTLANQKKHFLNIQRLEKAIEGKMAEMKKLQKTIEVVKILGAKIATLPPEKKQELALQSKRYLSIKGEISDLETALGRIRAEAGTEVTNFLQCPIQLKKIKPSIELYIGQANLKLNSFQNATGYYQKNNRIFALGEES